MKKCKEETILSIWKVIHESISEWWQNLCRPTNSHWHFVRVKSPLHCVSLHLIPNIHDYFQPLFSPTSLLSSSTIAKGQTKSKWIFQADVSSKRNKRIQLYFYETSGWLVFVRIWEEIEDTKKTFRNQMTFMKRHGSSQQLTGRVM